MVKLHKQLKWIGNSLFILYIIMMAYFLFFSESYGRVGVERDYQYNLEPFREIKRYMQYYEVLGMKNVIVNLLGNVVAFMPYGFWLPVISKKCDGLFRILLCSLSCSLAVEVTQFVTKKGSFDVDDLLLNTMGGLLGFWCYRIIRYCENHQSHV